jgi:PIN domain
MSKKKKKQSVPALKVIFDTNALYTEAAHFLVSQDVSEMIQTNSDHQDIAISWHLPEVVLHEREYQMRTRAALLVPPLERVERLLGHNLGITGDHLKELVGKAVDRQKHDLKICPIVCDTKRVNWEELCRRAAFREPPFETQKEGKGFRDALILEAILQLVEDSPSTPAICRIAIVTKDAKLADAIAGRVEGRKNVRVLADIEELKGLINTIVSEVPEEFVKELAAEARPLFFQKGPPQSGLLIDQNLRAQIRRDYKAHFDVVPAGAQEVEEGTAWIGAPSFVRKSGRQLFWTSQIRIELKAMKKVVTLTPSAASAGNEDKTPGLFGNLAGTSSNALAGSPASDFSKRLGDILARGTLPSVPTTETVEVATSEIIFHVVWSTILGAKSKQTKAKVEEIKLVTEPWGEPKN